MSRDHCCNCGRTWIRDAEMDEKLDALEDKTSFSFLDGWMELYENPEHTGNEDSPSFLYLCPQCIEKLRLRLEELKNESQIK